MKKTIIVVTAILCVVLGFVVKNSYEDYSYSQTKAKIEAGIFPIIEETTIGGVKCQPSFVNHAETSLTVNCRLSDTERKGIREELRKLISEKVGAWAIQNGYENHIVHTLFLDELTFSSKK